MPGTLVVDFDGTLTLRDIGDEVCDRLAPPAWRAVDARWVAGELSLPEAQRQMWGLCRGTREQAVAVARALGAPRPGLAALLEAAAERGVRTWLASGGFDFYIEPILDDVLGPGGAARFEARYYSTMRFEGDRLVPEFPHAALSCGRCGVCKGRVCDLARQRGGPVLFVGDGTSDGCAVGRADRLFAVRGSHLARRAREAGQPCLEIDALDELLPHLG